jgi:hypothetical protein
MPIAPRVLRTTPDGDITELPADDPAPVLVVLRWGGRVGPDAVTLEPGHKIAETANAARVQWTYRPAGKGSERLETDWFRAVDVLDHQPDAEEWREIVGRAGRMS